MRCRLNMLHELAALQADAPSMGWLFVKRRMRAELGADWQSHFTEFEKEAVSAASLGQVHKATTTDGKACAVKLQYPDMSSAIDADLKQLKLAFSVYERFDSAISTNEIYDELSTRLREELDYRREAQNMRLYQDMLKDESSAQLPDPIDALSTERLLTMSWVEGQKLMAFLETNPLARDAQPDCDEYVPRVVCAVLLLWGDSWGPSSW